MLKKIIKVILIAIPWFLTGLIFRNVNFLDKIKLPFFVLPKFLFPFAWTTLYILIAISIYKIYEHNKFEDTKPYFKALTLNYIFNQLFMVLFFGLKNIFLGFVDTLLIFITSLFLYNETKLIDKDASKYLIPYVIFNLYALILTISIYFMNL